MSDKGILFSAPMVRALIDGRKTQTRRLLRPFDPGVPSAASGTKPIPAGIMLINADPGAGAFHPAPYAVGDRLYVRETCRAFAKTADCLGIHYAADDRWIEIERENANRWWEKLFSYSGGSGSLFEGKFVPSIHMPRWASRLWLLVTDVRVQRLHECSELDAIAEGIDYTPGSWTDGGLSPCEIYMDLWNSLHKPGTRWADNPWIVAVSFEVHKGNIGSSVLQQNHLHAGG